MKKQKKNSSEIYLTREIMMREIISKLLDTDLLSGEVENKVLKEYLIYGKTYKEIAPLFKLTHFRVKQIVNNAFAIIKSRLSRHENIFSTLKKQQTEIEELKSSIAEKEETENQFNSLPEETQKLLSEKIETLPLDVRIINSCIKNHDIFFLRDLVKLTRRKFAGMRNIGKKSINEMDEFLNSKRLTWEMNV
ncbi:MAG: hypothetical protein HY840_02750 [Bacteroidetes bacterium]|nr:hypothetical protein [Bacteroidota bacterium]